MTDSAAVDNGNVVTHVDASKVKRVHFVGVAGTGMGSFAGLLKARGFVVTGSDDKVYPPMSDKLREWGIEVFSPYAADNVARAKPDLVIIGNVIRRENPEAAEVRQRRIPQMSFPAALGALCLDHAHSVVVAGTHGKTTTTAMMGHVLAELGLSPSYLVGGVPNNGGSNFGVGRGEHFVIEGDEYDTAYFDKGPKFLHYRPRTLLLTSVEYDHADIYRDLTHYESAFAKLVALVPADGTIAVSAAYPNAVQLARQGAAKVVSYAADSRRAADWGADHVVDEGRGAKFSLIRRGQEQGVVQLMLSGSHNIENSLGVIAAASAMGLSLPDVVTALASFSGVKRRQEVRGEPGGVLVIDDFAHHPTAVSETVAAIAGRYPQRRLWAVFEPRSNTSRRNIHQAEYAKAFARAAKVSIKVPDPHDKIPVGEGLDVARLAADLGSGGIPAAAQPSVEALANEIVRDALPGDVVLVMSNGAFGGLIEVLLQSLQSR